jgi:hypothetical protein
LIEKEQKGFFYYVDETNGNVISKECRECLDVKLLNEFEYTTNGTGIGGTKNVCKSCSPVVGRREVTKQKMLFVEEEPPNIEALLRELEDTFKKYESSLRKGLK